MFLLDEIFRGTNSEERIAISLEVLRYLSNTRDFSIVSTHDLALCKQLGALYQRHYFKESVCETGLSFDFKLHEGICTSRNAIALLQYAGYPLTIVENAQMNVSTTV